jgi:hypothetical protein
MLTAMIGAGLILWTVKRAKRRRDLGIWLVERLNVGFVGGTPLAFAAFFIANRLLPIGLPERAAAEVRAVFWTWAAVLLFAMGRPSGRAWRELLATTAVACAAVPVLDWATGLGRAGGIEAGVDVTALALAAVYAFAAGCTARAAA